MNFEVMKTKIVKTGSNLALKTKQYSPEILMGVGVVGAISATVMACKATLKVENVLDEHKSKLDKIEIAREQFAGGVNEETYSEKDAKKDKAITYAQTTVSLVKLYGPAALMGATSVGLMVGSHRIMKKRNLAVMAAYKTLDSTFSDYRKRVVDKYGKDVDFRLRHGIDSQKVDTIDVVDGKEKKVKKELDVIDGKNNYSDYARIFDETNPNWQKTAEYNKFFLNKCQDYLNDRLKAKGHVFLNEVYDELGFPRSQAGAVVGWVFDPENGEGDNYIDFNMFDVSHQPKVDFINGYERSVILDFNVDGIIYNLI